MSAFVPRSTDVCRRIAAARSASGLTHEGLAQNLTACTGLDVSTRDVRRFEKSRIPWQLLDEIARLTETSTTWLLYGEGPSPEAPREAPRPAEVGAEDANVTNARAWRPSAGRVVLGLLLGYAVGVAIAASTGSGPAAVAAAIGVALIPFLRGHGP